jgi:hypothetical protein
MDSRRRTALDHGGWVKRATRKEGAVIENSRRWKKKKKKKKSDIKNEKEERFRIRSFHREELWLLSELFCFSPTGMASMSDGLWRGEGEEARS